MKLSESSHSLCGASSNALLTDDSSIPFAQQFRYHLKDVPIVSFEDQGYPPEGSIKVRFPDISSVSVEINRRETIEEVRERIEKQTGRNLKNYYLVSDHGIIKDGASLDEYNVIPGSNLLVIPIGIRHSNRKTRDFWIKSRESRCESAREKHVEKTPRELAEIRRCLSSARGKFTQKTWRQKL